MTRKHYRAIAAALNATRPSENSDANVKQQWNQIVRSVANAVGEFNNLFDWRIFESACGGQFHLNS